MEVGILERGLWSAPLNQPTDTNKNLQYFALAFVGLTQFYTGLPHHSKSLANDINLSTCVILLYGLRLLRHVLSIPANHFAVTVLIGNS